MTKNFRIKKILQCSLIFVCLGLIYYYFKTHQTEIRRLNVISLSDIVILTFLLLTVQIIHCYKLFLLTRPLGLKGVHFFEWFRIITVSRFINQHVILGATFYRFIKLKKDHQFSYSNSLGLSIYYIWLEMISFFIIAIFILALMTVFLGYNFITNILMLIFIVCVLIPLPFVVFHFYKKVEFPKKHQFDEQIMKISGAVFTHLRNPKFLGLYLLMTFLFLVFYITTIKLAFDAINISLSFRQNLLFTVVLIMSRMFNIVPANIGVSELICGSISKAIDISFGNGIIIAGIVRVLNYGIYGTVTLIFYLGGLLKRDK